ncbi:MAG: hypothetical protein GEU83_11960 [Pseudonocardiaceae bacterium]|nr:hypothetical protein [Pseudonocardiaceae bacterium]
MGHTAVYQVILSTTEGDSLEQDVDARDAVHAAGIVGTLFHLDKLRDGIGRPPRGGTIRAVFARRVGNDG